MTNTNQETTSSARHTPEPWNAFGTKIKYLFDSGFSETIADIRGGKFGADDTAHANARRICAAVNACKGINTEALEQNVVGRLYQLVREAFDDNDSEILGEHWNHEAETILALIEGVKLTEEKQV
jgi:hypothetical protein